MVSDKPVADFTVWFHNLCSYNTMQPDLPKAKFLERVPREDNTWVEFSNIITETILNFCFVKHKMFL